MKRVLKHIIPELLLQDEKIFKSVHSAKKFAAILNRERDRSDRTGQEFSLVVFETGSGSRKSEAVRNLVSNLKKRIRSIDEIGRIEDDRIAVALPHTPSDDAWKFVANVRRALGGSAPGPDCTVYVYPSRWITRTDGVSSPPTDARTTPSQPDIPFPKTGEPGFEAKTCSHPLEEVESQFLCRIPFGKRAADIVGSLLAMILLSPLALLVALLIKTVSPGPIFFRQERVGYLGRVFTLWKFRTMHLNADSAVHRNYLRDLINNEKEMVKLDNGTDPRIIPFGHILRATGIDELPQLLNVLLGDMSLVGPRPCIPYEAREYTTWQMRRFDTVPGLTGLWQVSGKNRTTFKEMMRLDIGYAKKRAFLLDVKIFLKTLPAIVRQVVDRPSYAGAQAEGLSTVLRVGAVTLAILSLNTPRM
jgi:lipopolysaccharide/colanic/teichoic acid biosynthesis glycosyltransferase